MLPRGMDLRGIVKRLHGGIGDERVAISVIVAAGLVLRVLMSFGSFGILWPDSFDYYYEGVNIAATGTLSMHQLYHTPLYPFFLARFLSFGATPAIGVLIILAQRALGLAASVFFYKIARRVFGPTVAFWSGLLFALHTLMLYYETVVQTEALFVCGLSITIYHFLTVLDRPGPLRWAVFGALAGWLALIRPVAQLWAAAAILIIWLHGKRFKPCAGAGVCVLAGFFAGVLPWMAVNHQVYGFWGIARGQGLSLFMRVIEADRLSIRPDTKYPRLKEIFEEECEKVHCRAAEGRHGRRAYFWVRRRLLVQKHYSPLKADRLMSGIAVETLLAHPGEYALNTLRLAYRMLFAARNSMHRCADRSIPYLCCKYTRRLRLPPFPNQVRHGFGGARWLVTRYFEFAHIPMAAVSALALAGAIMLFALRGRFSPERLLLLLTILYFVFLTCAMQVPEDRYRLPIDALLFMFAVWALSFGAPRTEAPGADCREDSGRCHNRGVW